MGKKEETTDIIHYLYPQLIKVGIKIENTKQDVTNEKTGNLRGDLWISAYKQDSNNFWENILALIEAKHRKCVLGDKDWKDAMRQGEVKAKKQGLNFYIITNTKDLIRFYNAYTNEIIELDDKILTSFQSEDNLRLIQTQIGESNNKVYSKIRKSEFFLEKNFRKSLIRLSKVYRSCSIKKDDRIDPTVSFVILKYICEKEFEKRNLKKEVLLWDEYGNKTGNYKGDFISSSRDIFSGEYGREYEDFKDLIKLPEKLTNEHYKKIFKEFSQYHFHGCGFDVFGTIYEEFASQQKKKEFGEFYTRRHITKVICKLLLKDEIDVEKKIKIADPACGSGGFITEAFKILFDNYIRYGAKEKDILSKLKTETFWGFDNEPSSIARAKLNMFLVGDGHTHLYENDSLDGWNAKKEWREDYFDYVLTNPPYGIYDGEIPIENFDFTNESRYEMMFLEKIIKSVKVGGKIAVVIPDGVLESPSRANFRKKILEHCEVYAVVSLTKFAFAPYTKEKTYVMFMKKKPLSEISKMQKSPIWHFIVDYDGFANSDKRYPTPLHD
ncbi:MAG: SAM-dependent methyltransferase, partial [Nanoarchaeota archaeon]|nr:SAM-dependent methyltransferase [Nanoarchaeota archaeon]